MSRATVICHMAVSIDGKINGTVYQFKKADTVLDDYFQLAADNYGDRTRLMVMGRKTAMESGETLASVPKSDMPHELLRTDYVEPFLQAENAKADFVAAIDPHGRCAWASPIMGGGYPQVAGRRSMEIVVDKWVSDDFLAHCRRVGVPYLFAGEDKFEVVTFLQKAKTLLGQDAVLLLGGGVVNGSFLREGCVDELSIMTIPFVSGDATDSSVFDAPSASPEDKLPFADFTIVKSVVTPGGYLWTAYTCDKEPAQHE